MDELDFNTQFINLSQSCADSIAEATGCDVFIMNSMLVVLGGTVRYRKIIGEKCLNNSTFEQVLSVGESIETNQERQCLIQTMNERITNDYENETITCFPIKKDGVVFGVITITVAGERKHKEFIRKKIKILSLIHTTTELIISKIQERDYIKQIELIEQQFEALYSNMQDGIIVINSGGRIIRYNRKVEDCLKVKATSLKGLSIENIFPNIVFSSISNTKGESKIIELEHKDSGFTGTGLIIPIMVKDAFNGAIVNILTQLRIDASIFRSINSHDNTTFKDIIGESRSMRDIVYTAKKVAPFESSIVLYGESGTGKELFARAIHNFSHSERDSFVAINCSAIPENLIESELFGYEGGAFTGANEKGKPGKFELANGGTIFLDEISEMPLLMQPKLLRVIEEKKVMRLGGTKAIKLNIRIITATNKNLENLVKSEYFRQDLYYRINVIQITLPPLRERKDDIPVLIDHFSNLYSGKIGTHKLTFEQDAVKLLIEYQWKGNIRELQNLIESLYCTSERSIVTADFIKSRLPAQQLIKEVEINNDKELPSYLKVVPIENLNKNEIIKALNKFGNSTSGKKKAAQALGISSATLYRRIKKLGVSQIEKFFSI